MECMARLLVAVQVILWSRFLSGKLHGMLLILLFFLWFCLLCIIKKTFVHACTTTLFEWQINITFIPSTAPLVYLTRSGSSRNSSALVGLSHPVSDASGCKLRGQSYYLEVTLGCSISGSEKGILPNLNINRSNCPTSGSPSSAKGNQKVSTGDAPFCEKTFIYPSEAVLVPVLQTSCARSFLKRCLNYSTITCWPDGNSPVACCADWWPWIIPAFKWSD